MAKNTSILLVEDDDAIRQMLVFNLKRKGFRLYECSNAHFAREHLNKQIPDLILLDIMLPGRSGLELLQQLRNSQQTKAVPVIIISAKNSEEDKIKGLEMGADDYITKPFSPAELVARIHSLLRRIQIDHNYQYEQVDQTTHFKDLIINYETNEIHYFDDKIDLSPMEFKLLTFLIEHPNKVYSRSQLLDYVWGENTFLEERTVDVTIRRLRQSLELIGYQSIIHTIRGVGYRLQK